MKQKKLLKLILVFIIFIFSIKVTVFADVGDFETYSSDSSWSSSWSSSSWGDSDPYSSSWDSDWYSNSNSNYSGGNIDIKTIGKILLATGIGVALGVIIFRAFTKNDRDLYNAKYEPNYQPELNVVKDTTDKIKEIDPEFNSVEFSSWVRDLFIKLQYAWADRDWSTMRCFETKELYEQHSSQLQRYIQNKQINKLERVSVNFVKFLSFEQIAGKDILSVIVNSKMIDYIVDEETNEIIKGDKNNYKINNYKLTFVRKSGIKTVHERKINVMNCPNCGAPTEITSSGKCPYCGSIITTTEHDWVLSNLERYINIV